MTNVSRDTRPSFSREQIAAGDRAILEMIFARSEGYSPVELEERFHEKAETILSKTDAVLFADMAEETIPAKTVRKYYWPATNILDADFDLIF